MQINYNSLSDKVTRKELKDYKKLYPNLGKLDFRLTISLGTLCFLLFSFYYSTFSSQIKARDLSYLPYYLLPVFFTMLIVSAVHFQRRYRLTNSLRLKKFAISNNFEHTPEILGPEESGMMFTIMYNHCSYDVIKGNSINLFEIGNHKYDTGSSEKGTKTFQLGYIKIQLDRNLPHIVLDSKRNNSNIFGLSISNLPVSFKDSQILSLEGNFNSNFTLYAPKDYERDALYIFSPDLMSLFMDEVGNYDAEIIDNNLFIYSKKPFKLLDQNTLGHIFNIIDVVGKKTMSQTNNYSDGNVAAQSMNVVAEAGVRLKKRISNSVIFLILTFAMVFGFNIIIHFIPSIVKLFMK